MELQEKLDNLIKQKEQLEAAFLKTVGAIEMMQALISEKEKPKKKGK
tara:strand:- start:161 stop:301 length:141 start_codon:yes stop_codon:yes gene_type:complete